MLILTGHLEPDRRMNVWIRGVFSWLRDDAWKDTTPHVNVTPVASRICESCVWRRVWRKWCNSHRCHTPWLWASTRLPWTVCHLWARYHHTLSDPIASYTKIIEFIRLEHSKTWSIYVESGDCTRFWRSSKKCDKRHFERQIIPGEVWMTNWMCSGGQ